MKLVVNINCTNGYACSCCGERWNEEEEFEIEKEEDIIPFLEELALEIKHEYNRVGEGRKEIVSAYIVQKEFQMWKGKVVNNESR
jgi:hypothetical protein